MTRLWAIACAAAACASGPARTHEPAIRPSAPVVLERWTMGTRLRVIAWARERDVTAALDEVDRLDALLSTFRPDSALSELNRRAGTTTRVPAELHRFVRAMIDLSQRTNGAFDPTVGPLLAALRSAPTENRDAAIAAARGLVGYGNVEVREDGEAGLRLAGMAIDPGGAGKGWAVDAMVALLRRAGVTAAFIDFGESSFYGIGAPPGRTGWNVQLRDENGGATGPVIRLRDRSLSTSMSLAMPEEPGQPPRPHIVDPRTGTWIETPRLAAVVSGSATEADALSTAVVVTGDLDVLARFPDAAAWLQQEGRPAVVRGDFPLAATTRRRAAGASPGRATR